MGILNESYTTNTLPDKLYFSSPNEITSKTISAKLPRGLFLSPYIGISSMFIVDRHKEMRSYMNEILKKGKRELTFTDYNIEYHEWNLNDIYLTKPLKKVHMFHNIPEFTETRNGTSSGYIYAVDVSSIKNELQTYVTNDMNREIIYKGSAKLPIIEKMEHNIDWQISYKKQETVGKFDTKPIKESVYHESNKDIIKSEYKCRKCNTISKELHLISDMSKNEYEKAVKQFPSWDGRHGTLGIAICPNCGSRDYVISDNDISESVNILDYLNEEVSSEDEPPSLEDDESPPQTEENKKESLPKKADKAESNKNGIRRKNLYIAFIEWCKEYNSKNTFGSVFDKDAFHVSYPFVPEEMRYFYRLANPMLCVLSGDLTFFAVAELRKINAKNSRLQEMMIFAATPNDFRVFNKKDKKIYLATEENGTIKLGQLIGNTFDTYIQKMIDKGDILNAPLEKDQEQQ